jgi:hypothetical protein
VEDGREETHHDCIPIVAGTWLSCGPEHVQNSKYGDPRYEDAGKEESRMLGADTSKFVAIQLGYLGIEEMVDRTLHPIAPAIALH